MKQREIRLGIRIIFIKNGNYVLKQLNSGILKLSYKSRRTLQIHSDL